MSYCIGKSHEYTWISPWVTVGWNLWMPLPIDESLLLHHGSVVLLFQYVCFIFIVHLCHLEVVANACYLSQEPDLNEQSKLRWVLSVKHQHRCSCTMIIPGGVSVITPQRSYEPYYTDHPIFTDEQVVIHDYFGCYGKNDGPEGVKNLSDYIPKLQTCCHYCLNMWFAILLHNFISCANVGGEKRLFIPAKRLYIPPKKIFFSRLWWSQEIKWI